MRSSLSQRLGWLGSPNAPGEQQHPCPRRHRPPGPAQYLLPQSCPVEGAPYMSPHTRGFKVLAGRVLGFVRAGTTGRRCCRAGWDHHYNPPASLLLPPERAHSASLLCCCMSTPSGTSQGKVTVPWLPGFSGHGCRSCRVWSLPSALGTGGYIPAQPAPALGEELVL